MAVVTIYRLAESCFKLIEGGDPSAASSVSFNELKIACQNVINQLLKIEHFNINEKIGERIPNGSVLGWYPDIPVTSYNGKGRCLLPIKPLKLPRDMGVFAVYPKYTIGGDYEFDKEIIPLQMGQGALIKSQPLLSNILGQVGRETFGNEIIFTQDLKSMFPEVVVGMRLAVMDISLYGDYDLLPILPEQEWQVIQEVYKLYASQVARDAVVDSSVKELKNIPVNQQRQS